ncbi:MAG: hypothetical protein CMO32_08230 [Variovorax sp.]|nr:hypothetical protein [Variovorax sp.]
MLQMAMAAQMREDLSPWTKAGTAAQSLLSRYLGLGVGGSGLTSMGLQTGLTPDKVREQLLSRFTSASQPGAGPAPGTSGDMYLTGHDGVQYRPIGNGTDMSFERVPQAVNEPGVVDEAGLNAAIQSYYDEQKRMEADAAKDPTYGSLLRPYRNGEEFSFTGKDLASDPGYQFGLDQGTQGINRAQAARGNYLSGAAMKEIDRFNQDYAGTKFNDAYSRNLGTWNTNANAYNQNRNTIYNFLTGQSTMGQNSAAQVGTNSQQVASSVGNNITDAGNANAAASVASGNALASGLNQLSNSLRSNNGLNGAGGWNSLLSSFNIGRSGNNYNGSSGDVSAPNYANGMDLGVSF